MDKNEKKINKNNKKLRNKKKSQSLSKLALDLPCRFRFSDRAVRKDRVVDVAKKSDEIGDSIAMRDRLGR